MKYYVAELLAAVVVKYVCAQRNKKHVTHGSSECTDLSSLSLSLGVNAVACT